LQRGSRAAYRGSRAADGPGASTRGDSVPAQRGVSACAGTVSEWPLADCGQRMQPLSSVAYNWPPCPTNFRTSLSTLLSVSQPGHSPLVWGTQRCNALVRIWKSHAARPRKRRWVCASLRRPNRGNSNGSRARSGRMSCSSSHVATPESASPRLRPGNANSLSRGRPIP
jgi:hypothetical protein